MFSAMQATLNQPLMAVNFFPASANKGKIKSTPINFHNPAMFKGQDQL